MPSLWYVIALQVVVLCGGMLAGAVALAIGGAGGIRALSRRLDIQENASGDLNDRITREVKARAGRASAEKRTDADLAAEARNVLASAGPTTGPRARPSALRLQK